MKCPVCRCNESLGDIAWGLCEECKKSAFRAVPDLGYNPGALVRWAVSRAIRFERERQARKHSRD